MLKIFLFIFLIGFHWLSYSQPANSDQQLAQMYFNNGEYDKALDYYEKLAKSNPSDLNKKRWVECLIQTNDIKGAEKQLKRFIDQKDANYDFSFLLAQLYEKNEEPKEAAKIYANLVKNVPLNPSKIIELFNAFRAVNQLNYALETIEKGRKFFKDSYPFQFQFAEIYSALNQPDKMIQEYISILDIFPDQIYNLQQVLVKQIDFSNEANPGIKSLKNALISRVQKHPENEIYTQMLIWQFIQTKNFEGALLQLQAIDKRTQSDGQYIYDLGRICLENKDFVVAKKCFAYLIQKGPSNPYFDRSENAYFHTSFEEIKTLQVLDQSALNKLVEQYQNAIEKRQNRRSTLSLLLEMTFIQAFYCDRSEEASQTLSQALDQATYSDMDKAEIKMQLADILMLKNDIWTASLLYMQIDADFKYETIGQEAKFKNAKIFYYDGEFDYAQSQLDVLKQSTSKLIANDAMNLSILITDNFGLDSNFQAMYWFSQADLKIEQFKIEEAFQLFDSIIQEYPAHGLGDEILLKKAQAMKKSKNWDQEIKYLEELLKYYKGDILADDAIFMLAETYDYPLNNPEKALELYKKLLYEFPGSFFVTEARKRIRILRGDFNKIEE